MCQTLSAQLFEKTRLKSSHVLLFGHFFQDPSKLPQLCSIKAKSALSINAATFAPTFPGVHSRFNSFQKFSLPAKTNGVF